MSENATTYFLEDINGKNREFSNRKKFLNELKKLGNKPAKLSMKMGDSVTPLLKMNNTLFYENTKNETIGIDINSGDELEESYSEELGVFSIEKNKEGTPKYSVRQNKDTRIRYDIYGQPFDALLRKSPDSNEFVYGAYNKEEQRFMTVDLGEHKSIEDAQKSTKITKLDKMNLKPEYQYESIIADMTGVYPSLENTNFTYKRLFYYERQKILENYGKNEKEALDNFEKEAQDRGFTNSTHYLLKCINDRYGDKIREFNTLDHRTSLFATNDKTKKPI